MDEKKKIEPDDPKQSQRFLEIAAPLDADANAEAFLRALETAKGRPEKSSD